MSEAPRNRGLRIVLFVSLALNLLVVGMVAGLAVNGPPRAVVATPGADTALPYTRALTEEQRRALRGALRREIIRDRQQARVLRDAVLEGYREALAILRSEPFDPQALEAVMADQAARGAVVRARGQALLGRYLAGLSAGERAAYAQRLEAEIERQARRGARGSRPAPAGQ